MRQAITRIGRPFSELRDADQADSSAKLDLYCFPYAGARAWTVFDSWANELPDDVQRGLRCWSVDVRSAASGDEQLPSTSLPELLEGLLTAFVTSHEPPHVFLGHSMGALVSFELARALRLHGLPGPEHLIVSGRRAPQLPDRRPPVHGQAADVILNRLKELDGTPPEVLQQPEFIELFLPRLRADLAVCEAYAYEAGAPLSCSITALGGASDPEVNREDLLGWGEQTSSFFSSYTFPGGHFFPQTAYNLVLRVLTQDLRRVLRRLHRTF
jgi:medium-chain acyl-[acyl-carrier-protein] hydrolase